MGLEGDGVEIDSSQLSKDTSSGGIQNKTGTGHQRESRTENGRC
jgi:hypothetical protein